MAQSTNCPGCNKALIVGDVNVDRLKGPLKELRTCGKVSIQKKGRLMAELVEAHDGIECLGVLDARRVLSGAAVTLGPKAQWKGNLTAPSLQIENGARIHGGGFAVPDDPLGLNNLPKRHSH
jgi:cytoskeletal protein CcmA (bactofilin family)